MRYARTRACPPTAGSETEKSNQEETMSRQISRRRFTTAALAGGAVLGAPLPLRWAHAAEFVYKWGTNVPESHPLNVFGRQAAEAILKETNGRLELRLFANNQLGADADMFSQLRSGAMEFFTLSGVNVLSTMIPSAAIYGIGFAFPNYETLWPALGQVRRSPARSDHQGRLRRDGQDLGQRLPSDHDEHEAHRSAVGPGRGEDTGSRQLALDVAVQIARCLSHEHQFRGSLLSPPNEGRRRAGEPARDHLGSETVRSAKILFADQSYVGWLVVSGQPTHMGASSPRHPGRRVEERQCCRSGGARGSGPTEYQLDW